MNFPFAPILGVSKPKDIMISSENHRILIGALRSSLEFCRSCKISTGLVNVQLCAVLLLRDIIQCTP